MYRPTIIVQLLAAVLILLIAGCATLPIDFDRSESYALTDTENTALGNVRAKEKAEHPGKSGFRLLGNGLDAFVARAVLANYADRSIDVQYYLYHKDLVGKLFSDLLLKAADRGVRVRLLVDDMDLAGRDLSAAALDSHPNIEVRIFNPFSRNVGRTSQFVTRLGSVTRRMHNKTFTVDNQISILGGRNIGNEYFDADPDLTFADLDVMAIGPVVKEVSSVFDQYWNSELAYPASVLLKGDPPTPEKIEALRGKLNQYVADQADSEYLQALRNSDLANKLRKNQVEFRWGDAEVVFDQPEKLLHDFSETQYQLSPMLKPYWEEIEKELIIFSPYFVPGKSGTAFLTQLVQRGVRVRILTNSLASNDVGIVHAGYIKYRKDLLRGGVELYELNKKLTRKQLKEKKGKGGSSKASLHAKSFVFDRKQIFIGSLNLDPRALLHNTEIGVVMKVPEIAEEMATWFERHIDQLAFRLELKKDENGAEKLLWHGMVDGNELTFDVDPYTGFWRRFGICIMSIFPIESQL
ncbi:MAG: phospholipase D family protein [Ignavibacteriaceae bacterium]|jgi:cardiolipin synthase C|nr:phospholipase D family protein [Ignavibacteriaceae bacterium]